MRDFAPSYEGVFAALFCRVLARIVAREHCARRFARRRRCGACVSCSQLCARLSSTSVDICFALCFIVHRIGIMLIPSRHGSFRVRSSHTVPAPSPLRFRFRCPCLCVTLLQARQPDLPHLLMYGPPGSGKKTRIMLILKEIFGTRRVHSGAVVAHITHRADSARHRPVGGAHTRREQVVFAAES